MKINNFKLTCCLFKSKVILSCQVHDLSVDRETKTHFWSTITNIKVWSLQNLPGIFAGTIALS